MEAPRPICSKRGQYSAPPLGINLPASWTMLSGQAAPRTVTLTLQPQSLKVEMYLCYKYLRFQTYLCVKSTERLIGFNITNLNVFEMYTLVHGFVLFFYF